jgi:transposase
MAMTIVENRTLITGGVDTHLNFHVAAAIDGNGGTLGVEMFGVGRKHYDELLEWLLEFGELDKVGVEGTGSYGAGLARHLHQSGIEVVEVDRPNRQMRSRKGKSDHVDACGGRILGRGWSGCVSVLVDEAVASARFHNLKMTSLHRRRRLGGLRWLLVK